MKFPSVFIVAVIALFATILPALADTGIGLFTNTNAETIMEGNELCVTYKVYNPFDTDIWAGLIAEGNVANLTTYVDKPIFVPKATSHNNGKDMKICFAKENVHANCLIGTAFCRTCEPQTYDGSVVAYTTGGPSGSGSGSSTSAAAGQILRLTIACNPNPALPFRYLVYAGGIVLLAGILWWVKQNVRLEIGLKKGTPVKAVVAKRKRGSRKRPGRRSKRR